MKVFDLHGVKHSDVEAKIQHACAYCEAPFIVITGKSNIMKQIVSQVASEFGLSTRDTYDNPGRVIVE